MEDRNERSSNSFPTDLHRSAPMKQKYAFASCLTNSGFANNAIHLSLRSGDAEISSLYLWGSVDICGKISLYRPRSRLTDSSIKTRRRKRYRDSIHRGKQSQLRVFLSQDFLRASVSSVVNTLSEGHWKQGLQAFHSSCRSGFACSIARKGAKPQRGRLNPKVITNSSYLCTSESICGRTICSRPRAATPQSHARRRAHRSARIPSRPPAGRAATGSRNASPRKQARRER